VLTLSLFIHYIIFLQLIDLPTFSCNSPGMTEFEFKRDIPILHNSYSLH